MPQSAGLNHVWQHFSRNNKISRKNFKVPQVTSRNFFITKKKNKNAREEDRETEYLDKKETKTKTKKERERKRA